MKDVTRDVPVPLRLEHAQDPQSVRWNTGDGTSSQVLGGPGATKPWASVLAAGLDTTGGE